MSGGMNSIDAVKKKIRVLQEQAEEARERAERLQGQVDREKGGREKVRTPVFTWAGCRLSPSRAETGRTFLCTDASTWTGVIKVEVCAERAR